MDHYDIGEIIKHASMPGVDISPADRQEWAMFCCALKVLNYSLSTFVAMSNCDEAACVKKWNEEKNPQRYVPDEDAAKAKIIALAKNAGIDMNQFRLNSANATQRPTPDALTFAMNIDEKPKTPVFIEAETIARMRRDTDKDALCTFLCRMFSPADVRKIAELYQIGALHNANGSWTAFPYINNAGQCVDVHLMVYEADGHRKKTGRSNGYLLGERNQSGFRAKWPLFGEHILPRFPNAPVGIVESEKSAIIAALVAPGYIWLATGGESNLTPERCAALKGRECYIFPDVDGIESWRQKAIALRAMGLTIYFADEYVRAHAKGPKEDIADIICRHISAMAQKQEDNG